MSARNERAGLPCPGGTSFGRNNLSLWRTFRRRTLEMSAVPPPRHPREPQRPSSERRPQSPSAAREPQRIAKLLARAGIASRRDIERMIEERRIAIDGVPVEKPATLTVPGPMDPTGTTLVVRDNNVDQVRTTLPQGAKAAAQVAIKGTTRVDFAKVFSALLEVFYSHDRNQTHQTCIDPDQCQSEFGPPNQLGLNATLQARF